MQETKRLGEEPQMPRNPTFDVSRLVSMALGLYLKASLKPVYVGVRAEKNVSIIRFITSKRTVFWSSLFSRLLHTCQEIEGAGYYMENITFFLTVDSISL